MIVAWFVIGLSVGYISAWGYRNFWRAFWRVDE